MAEYYSKATLLSFFRNGVSPNCMMSPVHIERMLDCIPTVDAEPLAHGRWTNFQECLGHDGHIAYSDEHIVCSTCDSVWNITDNDTERFDYCPACGAKMDGDAK